MNERLLNISKTRKTWKNATRNVKVSPLRYFFPTTVQDIKDIIIDAETKDLRVRAVGSGHSFSEVAKGRDYLLNMKHLDKIEKIDPANLKEKYRKTSTGDRYFVKTEAGITIRDLNKKLDKIGLALLNMGAVNYQTTSGALSTATHGTGINMPAFPDMVQSLYLVTHQGKLMQIEPTDGITDPAKFKSMHGEELVQDDDIFYSAVVSLGAMGIIYAITFDVVPEFWIKESRKMIDWKELKEQLTSGDFIENVVRKHDYVSFRVNPYLVKGKHLASVVVQDKLPGKPKLSINARFKNLRAEILGNIPLVPWLTIWYLNIRPQAIPSSINTFLKGTKDKEFIGRSHKTLFQSGPNIRRHGISSEFSFPVDGKLIAGIIEVIIKQADENRKVGKLYQSSHVPCRFVMPSKAFMSTSYNRATAYIDLPLLQRTIGDFEILERYQDLIFENEGIPHWGKINNRLYGRIDVTQKNFPMLKKWQEVRAKLDPKGTFISSFMEKTELV
jgi:L-gulono-1,4-lactone dehydrogenase